MSAQTLLSGGDKWFSYSGVVFGDVSVPATIQLNFIPNTGLRDSLIQIQPFFGLTQSSSESAQLGLLVKLNDVEIIKQLERKQNTSFDTTPFNLFIPRQSKLEVISLNSSGNNTQERGCNVIGYYL
jgi:hypothetical protein